MEANRDIPRRNLLITFPRTASNLLMHILNLDEQPNLPAPGTRVGYFFHGPFMKRVQEGLYARHVGEWTEEQRTAYVQDYRTCAQDLLEVLDTARNHGNNVFIKEHILGFLNPVAETRFIYGKGSTNEEEWMINSIAGSSYIGGSRTLLNETLYSDEFLLTWQPTFLIRHPILAFPSYLRATKDIGGDVESMTKTLTMHFSRTLYDWYVSNLTNSESGSNLPYILDADDIVLQPEYLFDYSALVGLDPTKLRFSWGLNTQRRNTRNVGSEAASKRFLSTLSESTGIVKGKTSVGLDIDEEAKKWKVEFGDGLGSRLEEAVKAAMLDYLYMKERRLQPKKKITETPQSRDV
jgi:hypothetical protein